MLRITENLENSKTVRLRLDGTVSNDNLLDLHQAIAQRRDGAERTIILDMAGVEFMHNDAAIQLAKLRADDLHLINCSPFIAALLETITEG